MDQANHQPKEQSAEQRKGRGPGRPFQKGQSGNPAGRPPGVKSSVEEYAKAELLESLALMKKVLKQDESQDRTNEERHYRGWLKENRSAFMAKKADLERALLAREPEGPAPRKPDDALPPDEGEERAMAALAKVLDYHNRKQAEEDAELAKRPNAAQFAGTLQKSLKEALRREAALQAEVDDLRKKVERSS